MIWCISHRKTDHTANRSRFCRRIADARLMQKRLSDRRQAENLRSPFSILKKIFVKIFYFPNCINMQFLGPNGLIRYLRLLCRQCPRKGSNAVFCMSQKNDAAARTRRKHRPMPMLSISFSAMPARHYGASFAVGRMSEVVLIALGEIRR